MSYKVKRLAVLLCGDLRTWEHACENIFKYTESLSETVDYYFATWDSTRDVWIPVDKTVDSKRAVTEQEITSKFAGKNLISCKIMSLDKFYPYIVTFYFQSYLAKIANIEKRKYELANDFVYDQVIEMRPDLGIDFSEKGEPHANDQMRNCENFEYKISHIHYGCDIRVPHLTDFYYRTNSATNDILANRYWFQRDTMSFSQSHSGLNVNNHWLLLSYTMHRRLVDNETMSDPSKTYTSEEHGIWPLRPASVTDRR